jgi:hypothetical protein
VGCCGMLWDVVGCCGMLWGVVGCCGMLWDVVGCCGMQEFLSIPTVKLNCLQEVSG